MMIPTHLDSSSRHWRCVQWRICGPPLQCQVRASWLLSCWKRDSDYYCL